MAAGKIIILNVFVSLALTLGVALIEDENVAWDWFEEYGRQASLVANKGAKISWDYATNITDENERREIDYSEIRKVFTNQVAANASLFDYKNFQNSTLKKEFKALADKGSAALGDNEFKEINRLGIDLESIYGKATLCNTEGDTLSLSPDLEAILETSRNPKQLLWVWKNWRDATGKKMRLKYLRFTELQNMAARLNGYDDAGASWRSGYDIEQEGFNFRDELERLYDELKPFYRQLHTYVKNKLKAFYGKSVQFPASGHIPAHLLGNMWAQTWVNIEDLVLPYSTSPPVNATPAIQKLTVREMFNISDEFFTSLGLEPVTQEFWDNSMLERPDDGRDVVCHASAWDFNDGKDVRIKQCTRRNMEDFVTVHHEMGHIQYYLQYKDLHYAFRTGANPGFHEAVGDVLALSVSTPEHLKKIGLIDSFQSNNESNINYMMSIALEKIVFLPFGKLMDDYRWALFDGNISSDNLNAEWWKRRCAYQGISPPVERSENDFDPGAKYHIPANVPYVRYFVSFVLQFQFHKALCAEAGHTGPLHTCDIYQSTAAGEKLGDMLKLGSSKEWTVALKAITGNTSMSAEPLMEYFQPLMDYLQLYNEENGQADESWSDDCPTNLPKTDTVESASCVKPTPTASSCHCHLQYSLCTLFTLALISIVKYFV